MTNEELCALADPLISSLRMLSEANPDTTPRILAGVARLDDGTDQYRIYEIEEGSDTEAGNILPKPGQRVCFIGKSADVNDNWIVALFQFATLSALNESMLITLPLASSIDYLALQVFDYIVNGNINSEKEPPAFNQ